MSKKWYVIHAQTGCEERVRKNLEKRLNENPAQKEFIKQVLIPTEQIAEIKKVSEQEVLETVSENTVKLYGEKIISKK